jgi:hypothetical protein
VGHACAQIGNGYVAGPLHYGQFVDGERDAPRSGYGESHRDYFLTGGKKECREKIRTVETTGLVSRKGENMVLST